MGALYPTHVALMSCASSEVEWSQTADLLIKPFADGYAD